jgi:predicted Fe-S protein YdhL (DUF1289 family)
MTPESPCKKVCYIDDGYCVGCQRSMSEIRDWMILSDEQKSMVLAEVTWRKEELAKMKQDWSITINGAS